MPIIEGRYLNAIFSAGVGLFVRRQIATWKWLGDQMARLLDPLFGHVKQLKFAQKHIKCLPKRLSFVQILILPQKIAQ